MAPSEINPIIRGEKVYLRPFEGSDREVYKRWRSDAEPMATAEFGYRAPLSDAEVDNYIGARGDQQGKPDYQFVICLLENDRAIGNCMLQGHDVRRRQAEYGIVIGTDNPDLTGFRDRGGKMIIWHGWADQLITADGTIDYYKRVQQQMGGAKKTSDVARLFLAPGVSHCAGGPGPQPTGVLDALLTWVEDGKAPDTLSATRHDQTGAVMRSRPLCQYPLVAKYKGTGSTDEAANFVCSTGF